MRRSVLIRPLLVMSVVVWACGSLFVGVRSASGAGATRSTLYSELEAASIGLTRPWFQQVTMDINRDKITHVTLQDNTLFITTDGGRLHVIDGKTGVTLWSRIIGDVDENTLPPAANSQVVVAVHGTTIHVFDRFNGKRLLAIPIYEPPGGGPQVSERFIYLPTLNKKVYAYPLRKLKPTDPSSKMSFEQVETYRKSPSVSKEILSKLDKLVADKRVEQYQLEPVERNEIQACPAIGHPLVQPVLCSQELNIEAFSWVTDINSLMIAHLDYRHEENALNLTYRVSLAPELLYTDPNHLGKIEIAYLNEMNWRPTFVQKDISQTNLLKGPKGKGGLIMLGAGSGFVFAVNDLTGDVQWKFPAGVSVADPIGVCGENCFVPTFNGTFFCVDMKTGKEKWRIPRILQYITSGKSRLYAISMLNKLVVLNLADGRPIDSLPLDVGAKVLFNVESDRIFIVAPDGLIQCLHEVQSDEPVYYRETTAKIASRLKKDRDDALLGGQSLDAEGKNQAAPAVAPAPANDSAPAAAAPKPVVQPEDNPFADNTPDEKADADAEPKAEPKAESDADKPSDAPEEESVFDTASGSDTNAEEKADASSDAAADEKDAPKEEEEGANPFE